jgi:hypothetical protein
MRSKSAEQVGPNFLMGWKIRNGTPGIVRWLKGQFGDHRSVPAQALIYRYYYTAGSPCYAATAL